MLTVRAIRSPDYYLDLSSKTTSEYYAGSGEAPGRWVGRGLEMMLLAGAEVAGEAVPEGIAGGRDLDEAGRKMFAYLCSRQAAEDLFPPQRRPRHIAQDRVSEGVATSPEAADDYVAGWDMTFSAPKGLSIVAEVTPDDGLRVGIHACQQRAVERTLAKLEQVACWGREGAGGAVVVEGGGFIGATFQHRTSRPVDGEIPDPHLHTHFVAANLVRHPDGTWGALDGRAIMAWQLAAGALFRQMLVEELESAGIYLPWIAKNDGSGLIEVDLDPAILKAFSRRHEALVEAALASGNTSAGGRATAQRSTREAKDREVAAAPERELAALLRSRLSQITLSDGRTASIADVMGCVHRDQSQVSPALSGDALDAIAAGLVAPIQAWSDSEEGTNVLENHLTAMRSTFRHEDTIAAIGKAVGGTATTAEAIIAAADRLLKGTEAVALDPEPGRPIRTRVPPWQARWTTREILTLESRVTRMAKAGVGAGVARASERSIDKVLKRYGWLSDEQREMVRHITGSGNAVDVAVGVSGSGKTSALGAARAVWLEERVPVIGCALAGKAARGLEGGSGIRSTTLTRLLMDLDGEEGGLEAGTVVVVDEASMTDTRQLARLADHVARAHGKLVLVGDHRQLQAVEAGGIYRSLVEQPDIVVELHENRRQSQAWEAEVLASLREGEEGPERAVRAWTEHGRLVIHDEIGEALADCARGWVGDHREGKDTIMLATTLEHVDALNAVARAWRIEAGEITEGVEVASTGQRFAVGDRVIGLRGDGKIGILNGDRGTVTAVMLSQRKHDVSLVITLDDPQSGEGGKDRKTIEVPAKYLKEGRLGHGYATTTHKSQGMTLDTSHVLAIGNLSRELGYVATGRHRESVTIHAVDPQTLHDDGTKHGLEIEHDATEDLVRALTHRSEELAASAYGPGEQGVEAVFRRTVTAEDARDLYRERVALGAEIEAGVPTVVHDKAVLAAWRAGAEARSDEESERAAEQLAQARADRAEARDWAKAHGDILARHQEITDMLVDHARQMGQEAVVTRPAHLVALLGEPPILASSERRWITAAGAVEAYRERWGVASEDFDGHVDDALASDEQQEDLARVERVIAKCQAHEHKAEAEREEAAETASREPRQMVLGLDTDTGGGADQD